MGSIWSTLRVLFLQIRVEQSSNLSLSLVKRAPPWRGPFSWCTSLIWKNVEYNILSRCSLLVKERFIIHAVSSRPKCNVEERSLIGLNAFEHRQDKKVIPRLIARNDMCGELLVLLANCSRTCYNISLISILIQLNRGTTLSDEILNIRVMST